MSHRPWPVRSPVVNSPELHAMDTVEDATRRGCILCHEAVGATIFPLWVL